MDTGGLSKSGADKIEVEQVKRQFYRIISRVRAGEEFIIIADGQPVAGLAPADKKNKNRVPDLDKGLIKIKENFDVLPGEIQAEFEE